MDAPLNIVEDLPQDEGARMKLAVNHALNDWATQRSRMRLALGPGVAGSLDTKREQAYCEYGFPTTLDFAQFENLYRRGGVAHGAVTKVVGKCWLTEPEVVEGEEKDKTRDVTPWEEAVASFARKTKLWRAFREADRRRLVGRYSAIIIQFRNAGAWDQPVTRSARTPASIVKLIPAWEGQLQPVTFDEDKNSETYGEVLKWRFKEPRANNVGGRDIEIHRDRIFIVGDLQAGAVGFLEPAYNNFVSMEKIEGGAGEGFLKNAARQLSFAFDKDANLSAIATAYNVPLKDLKKVFNSVAQDVNRGTDSVIATQGANVTTLTANMPDPQPHYNVNLQTAAAGLNIPTKILVGMQTGERASSEDQKEFNATCQSRRGDLGDEIESFIGKMIQLRVLDPVEEFTVVWDDLTEATKSEKLANAKTMSEINSISLATGGELFTGNEVREAAGYEPEADLDERREPGLPEGDPTTDPYAPPPEDEPLPPQGNA